MNRSLAPILWLLVFGIFQQLGFGQVAQITGRVTDPSQAVLPGVTITVTNEQTGVKHDAITNESGYYTLPQLKPGTYRIAVELPGFRRMSRGGVKLDVEQVARLDFQLEIGEMTESIEVVGAPPLLETSRPTVGQVIENKRILDLPLNGRNPFELAGLMPGVIQTSGWAGGTPQLGGGRNAANEVQIDGVSNVTPENNPGINRIAYTPQVDSVQEFKVELNSLSAEYGRYSGGVINVVTKSGTNDVHGTAYWFHRNDVLDANNFFANRAGREKGGFKRNQYGGTLGGPLIRDRTFWYVGFEGSNDRSQDVFTGTIPPDAWRQGDFSNLRDSSGRAITIYDPATVREDPNNPGLFIRDPFPNNIIPQERINNVANNVIQFYPQPNATPTNPYTFANNFVKNGSRDFDNYRIDSRIDHHFSENWQTFGRYSTFWSDLARLVPWDNPGAPAPSMGGDSNHSVSLSHTITLDPTLIANIRYGFGRAGDSFDAWSLGFDVTELGLPESVRDQDAVNGMAFPRFRLGGTTTDLGLRGARQRNFSMNHVVSPSLTKHMGSHTLKFGAEWRKLLMNFDQVGPASYSFNRDWTQREINTASNLEGFPLASFLLGLGGASIGHESASATANSYWAFYIQDDWKVTPRLTFNWGLRYDMDIPRTERFNRLSFFDISAPSPIASQVSASPICPSCGDLRGAMRFVTPENRRQTSTDRNNFGPRLGLAYRLTDTIVVRAGYGINYMPSVMQAAGTAGGTGMQGFASETVSNMTFDNMRTIHTTLDDPFKDGYNLPLGSAGGEGTDLGFNINSSFFDNTANGMIQQWNLNIQQQLAGDILVEVGYLGNRGTHLPDGETGRSFNQLSPDLMALGPQLFDRVDNPFYGVITDPPSPLSQEQVNRNQLLRPFPQYSGVAAFRTSGGNSMYHGMILRADKRFSGGLSFLVSYTFSKLMDDASSAVNWLGPIASSRLDHTNRRLEWSLSSMDVSQRFVASWVYELPFGKGRRFGTGVSGVWDFFVSGWQTNGILTLARGMPIFISGVPNDTGIFSGQRALNSTGRSGHISGDRTTDEKIGEWFDTSVFSIPAPFTFGNVSRTLPDVRNPGTRNLDLSFFKNYSVGERFTVQYRAEMFNAFNTPQFNSPNNNIQSSNFGVITSAGSARQIQMALKFIW